MFSHKSHVLSLLISTFHVNNVQGITCQCCGVSPPRLAPSALIFAHLEPWSAEKREHKTVRYRTVDFLIS